MNSTSKKIGLIGRIDPDQTMFDGQTVKTRMTYRMLCEHYGTENVVTVDTLDYRHRALAVMANFARCLVSCSDIVVSLAINGRRVFFPLLSFASRFMGIRVYHNLIGGSLANDLDKYPKWVNYLNSFQVNWVESRDLVDMLAEKGVTNAEYLPNFKYFDQTAGALKAPMHAAGEPFSFCTFSRVTEQKGVGDAARAVESLNAEGLACVLDVYGPVDSVYKTDFEHVLAECPHVKYKGCVPPEQSALAVAPYDALLFPTKWKTEGIPGTIIDALAAGVPVIAARWQYYAEMLEDNVTGLGYELGDNSLLVSEMAKFMQLDNHQRMAMRKSCLSRFMAYTPEVVSSQIFDEIEGIHR